MTMQNIPIFLASDDNYAPFLCTTIYSILENTNSFIDFYVLDGGIDENTKSVINQALNEFKNYSIKYFNMAEFDLNRFPNLKHYSVNTFSRYFIAELVPYLEKVLYIDVDIIVKKDISELYNIDLEYNSIAAVSEDFYELNGKYLKENLKNSYKDISNYFNAGVLVMDLNKIRQNKSMDTCVEETVKLADKLNCPDQDILNIVFEDDVKILEPIYNYMPDFKHLYKEFYGEEKANELRENAVIFHFTNGKPWQYRSCENKLFWDIAEKTPFKDGIYEKFTKNCNKYTFFEKIFSIKKVHTFEAKIKVLTILGFKFKLKTYN